MGRRVGTRGNVILGEHGHELTATTGLQGNNVKRRHDHLKWVIGRCMSVLNVTVEATDLFSHLFTNEAYLAQSKSARQRQGICPDFWVPII